MRPPSAVAALLSAFSWALTLGSESAAATRIVLEPVVTGLDAPLYVTHARDGSGRLFIVEQAGRIKVLQPGAATPTIFLDLSPRVLAAGEQGLLGLAFHPGFTLRWPAGTLPGLYVRSSPTRARAGPRCST